MPIIVLEKAESRRLVSRILAPAEERSYEIILRGGGNEPMSMAAAETALLSFTPYSIPGLENEEVFVRRDFNIDPETKTARWAAATVTYGIYDPSEQRGALDRADVSFQVSADSVHIQRSLETVDAYVPEDVDEPLDFKGALNVDGEGNVAGTDIIVPHLVFNETHWLPFDFVTAAWVKNMAGIVGRMNAGPFRGFDPGEVMLIGLTGSKNYEKRRWDLTYAFDTSPNAYDIPISDDLTVSEKLGFDYLWVRYVPTINDDPKLKLISTRPVQANVERVYRFADYSAMGIGT